MAWAHISVTALTERENGDSYYGYDVVGEHKLTGGWRFEYRTKEKTAQNINQQAIVAGRKWLLLEVGAGIVSKRYSKPRGAIDLSMPLPGGGVTYTTDFKRVRRLDASMQIDLQGDAILSPYLLFVWTEDFADPDSRRYLQGKLGVKITLRQQEDL